MLKGDVDRFYQGLRQRWPSPPGGALPDLNHVREIADYYAQIDPSERKLLLAWARKEEAGIGLIPMVLSGIPLVSLIFSPLIQAEIKERSPWAWVALWAAATLAIVAGFWVHQRQRAITTLHIELLQQLCGEEPKE